EITIEFAGIYNIQFSAQLDKTDSGEDDVEIWLMKNGNNVDDTATVITLSGNNAKSVAAWNFFVDADANDYFVIMIASSGSSTGRQVTIHAGSSLVSPPLGIPDIPSTIVTVNQVG
ncbi:MAG: hypothetical protein ACO4AV_16020, partial [bacterium]